MPSKEKVKKDVVWASGRGGAGNVHKARATKSPVDAYIPKQQKMLEVETARNRKTTTGRGGTGNKFHHAVEPGVFQRVLDYEVARIMVHKAEEQANKAYKKTERKRIKFTMPSDEPVHHIRPPTRLCSASTSTFSTSVTSVSGTSGAPSSYVSSAIHSTRSPTPTASIAGRLFSPFKKRLLRSKVNTQSLYSTDGPSMHTIIISPYCERSSSSELVSSTCGDSSSSSPIVSTRCSTSISPGFIPHRTDISCAQPPPPRFETARARQELRQGLTPRPEGYSDIYGFSPRSFIQSSTDISVDISSSSHISAIRREQPFLQQDHRSNQVLADDQIPRFTANRLPLRAIGGHHGTVIPTVQRQDGVLFF